MCVCVCVCASICPSVFSTSTANVINIREWILGKFLCNQAGFYNEIGSV